MGLCILFFFLKWVSLVEQQLGQLHVERTGNRSKGVLSPLQVSHLLQLLWTTATISQTINDDRTTQISGLRCSYF